MAVDVGVWEANQTKGGQAALRRIHPACLLSSAVRTDTARKKPHDPAYHDPALPASTTQNRRLLLRLLSVFYNSSLKGEGNMVFLLKGLLVSYTQGAKLSEFCLATQNHIKWLPPNTHPESNCPESVTGRLSGRDSGRDSTR